VRILQALQPGELSDAEMNPFYFKEPVAPLVAARKNRREIKLKEVVRTIKQAQKKCSRLLVEGSGGLLVPLGKNYTVADLIARLNCPVIVVARNRLGTINHTLLTVNALRSFGVARRKIAVVLMEAGKSDRSSATNQQVLGELLNPIKTFRIPFLGSDASGFKTIKKVSPRVKNTLTRLLRAIGNAGLGNR
jgi:dethiobiotin synthetase